MDDSTIPSSSKRKRSLDDDEIKRAAKKERRDKQKKRAKEADPATRVKKPAVSRPSDTIEIPAIVQTPVIVQVPAAVSADLDEEAATGGDAAEDDSVEIQEKKAIYKERKQARHQRKKAAAATNTLEARISFPEGSAIENSTETLQKNIAADEPLNANAATTTPTDILSSLTQPLELAAASSQSRQASKPEFKRERTAKRRQQKAEAVEAVDGKSVTSGRRKEKKQLGSWAVSDPTGGRFVEADPVFTADEKYMILATEADVNVYTTEDSLLAHSLHYGQISAYTLSASQPNVLWIATEKGHIVQWNFIEEKVYGGWTTGATIHEIYAVGSPSEANDTLYTIDRSRGWSVTAHRIGIDGDLGRTELATLLNNEAPIRSLRVIDQGRTIIAISFAGLLVGTRATPKDTPFQQQKYDWRDYKTTEPPTCLAVNATANAGRKSTVDVAIGGVLGCIYLYKDVTNNNFRSELSTQLHWHREAVGDLAWSLDGNYLISGGRETVLVLWQLETGAKQFLPHLESPIENIVVSPTGASYGVRLADNSVMVLSTSELTPTTNIAGLQSFGLPITVIPKPRVDTVTPQRQTENTVKDYVVSVINPARPSELLVLVPTSQSGSESAQYSSTPYLQTYDLSNARHLRRQAITRTNATNTNTGPGGERLKEPDVKLMRVSPNGRWMATVEEWTPPIPDVKDMTLNEDVRDELDRLYETKLKIWAWSERDQVWALNSRIDSPHADTDKSMRVLDLVVDPTGSRFATVGSDSMVKLWTPRSKSSSGRTVKNEALNAKTNAAEPETWWSLDVAIPLESSYEEELLRTIEPKRAKLAFSEDGTILAAHEHFGDGDEAGLIHFIDPERGQVTESRSGLHTGLDGIHQIGFLGRHLICVGRANAFVWDITNFELKAQLALGNETKVAEDVVEQLVLAEEGMPRHSKDKAAVPPPQLAIDRTTSTFAVVTAVEAGLSGQDRKSKINQLLKYRSKLQVFSTEYDFSNVARSSLLPHLTLSIHPASGTRSGTDATEDNVVETKGYMLLDIAAEVRFMRPGTIGKRKAFPAIDGVGAAANVEPTPAVEVEVEVEDMMAMVDIDEAAETQQDVDMLLTKDEDDRPVVRMQELANVFDYPSHAMPSVKDMFASVLNLFASKTPNKPSTVSEDVIIPQEVF